MIEPPTPTHREIIAGLGAAGGVLMDVGCGAGAASLPVASACTRIVAVDEDPEMLGAMARLAGGSVQLELIEGRWPEVAARAGRADVVVCANVAYNVADLAPFVGALTRAARRRVVLELSASHPQAPLNPLWKRFWGLERPAGPTAEEARAVVEETVGRVPTTRRWRSRRSFMGEKETEALSWVRRRLCLPADREAELAAAIEELGGVGPRQMVTLSWEGDGGRE